MIVDSSNASEAYRALLAQHPGVRLASRADGDQLLGLLKQTDMALGAVTLGIDRGNDYFALLSRQGHRSITLAAEREGAILGMGTLTFRDGNHRGRAETIGYLQDLRFSPRMDARLRRAFFASMTDAIRAAPELPDFAFCNQFLTAILEGNTTAKRALSRPSFALEYALLTRYDARLWPKVPLAVPLSAGALFSAFSSSSPSTSDGLRRDWDEAAEFFAKEASPRAFELSPDDLQRQRAHALPIVLRKDGRVRAACFLIETDAERAYTMAAPSTGLRVRGRGCYVFNLRSARGLSPAEADAAERAALLKAAVTSLTRPGVFFAVLAPDGGPRLPAALALAPHARVAGELYRVFHPDHGSRPGFHRGFLRPGERPALEVALL